MISESHQNAVILIDSPNVVRVTSELLGDSRQAADIVHRLVEELKKYVSRSLGFNVVRTMSFSTISGEDSVQQDIRSDLLSNGIEQHVIYTAEGEYASSIELALTASQIFHSSADIGSFIVLSGDRWFVPLAQYLKRNGRTVLVSSLETPTAAEQVPSDLVDCFFNARTLLQKAGKQETDAISMSGTPLEQIEDEPAESQRPEQTEMIEDSIARQGMEIIEMYFGQYREIYLTPLLRKLTELLEEEGEPKTVINYLEECGAIWLEKRRGFPHNYTVLLVNSEHPDVTEIKALFQNEDRDLYSGEEVLEDTFDDPLEEYIEDERSFEEAHD
ncbi:MAG: NYN domain-containing protein [Rhodothermia bacterium]|nr:MAG: NYN domain-containing protein [Rhodothermia bacterium]